MRRFMPHVLAILLAVSVVTGGWFYMQHRNAVNTSKAIAHDQLRTYAIALDRAADHLVQTIEFGWSPERVSYTLGKAYGHYWAIMELGDGNPFGVPTHGTAALHLAALHDGATLNYLWMDELTAEHADAIAHAFRETAAYLGTHLDICDFRHPDCRSVTLGDVHAAVREALITLDYWLPSFDEVS